MSTTRYTLTLDVTWDPRCRRGVPNPTAEGFADFVAQVINYGTDYAEPWDDSCWGPDDVRIVAARVEPVEPEGPPGLLTGADGTEEARTDLEAALLAHRLEGSGMAQRPAGDLGFVGSFAGLDKGAR